MVSENEFLYHAFLIGIWITFVYDGIRILRRVVPHNNFFVSVEDLGFWIYCGIKVFLLMYRESDGTLRWFAVLGALAGMFLYKKLVSSFFVRCVSMVLLRFFHGIGCILRKLFRPAGILIKKAGNRVRATGNTLCILIKRVRRRGKNKLTYTLRMLKMSLKKRL